MRRYVFLLLVLMSLVSSAARIKDIAHLSGIRDNQLIGYGLVVGLDRTGDRTNQVPFTDQTFRNMLLQFGIKVPQGLNLQTQNVAAVVVSATLHPFSRVGQTIDVLVSSIGNASSLRNGTLLMLPLRGADGEIYAMAQGAILVSGVQAGGLDGSKVTVNAVTVGMIPNGATIERTLTTSYIKNGAVTFEIKNPDFTTAQRVSDRINKELGYRAASPVDPGAVTVKVSQFADVTNAAPDSYVPFISAIENLIIDPGERPARIAISARSGTVVINQDVTIAPVAVSHGNISVSVAENEAVSQPNAFGGGRSMRTNQSNVQINQQKANSFLLAAPKASLQDIIDGLMKVGASSTDLMLILEAINQAGSLNAELVIM
jgi:flagellar P-ring protein FlgI